MIFSLACLLCIIRLLFTYYHHCVYEFVFFYLLVPCRNSERMSSSPYPLQYHTIILNAIVCICNSSDNAYDGVGRLPIKRYVVSTQKYFDEGLINGHHDGHKTNAQKYFNFFFFKRYEKKALIFYAGTLSFFAI